jgi:segregation and condensation protein B
VSRKSRGKKKSKPSLSKASQAVPEEVLAEGSGPVEGAVVHVGIDTIAADELEPIIEPDPDPATVEDLAAAAESIDVMDAVEAALEEAAIEATAEAVAAGADPDAMSASDVEDVPPDQLEELTDEEAAEIGAVLPTSAASMDSGQLKLLVEALVFASDKPMTLLRLRQLSRVSDTRRLEQALAELAEDYKERGIVLQQVSGGYQFRTRTQFSAWVQQLIAGRPVRLSRAQLETLAIIAYRQPITRPEIDEIRGVDSSATLKLLLDRSLIRILGKKEEVGRPMLYGTTKEFLDFFSLGDLRELPTLREYSELTDESRRVMTDELGLDPDADPMAPIEPVEDEAEVIEPPVSIEDMVASYSASMDESAVEVEVSEPEPQAEEPAAAAEDESLDLEAATSTLESLAARRMANDEAEPVEAAAPDVEPEPEPEPEPEEDQGATESVDTLIAADAASDDVTSSTDEDTNR